MTERTYGETQDCAGCRYWSEMMAHCSGGGPIKAMCIHPAELKQGKCVFTVGKDTCANWTSGEYGAVDQPGGDPYEELAEEEDDDEDEICSGCSGSGEGMYDGSTCYKCHGSGVEPGKREDDDG
jgi:hypothetical protein